MSYARKYLKLKTQYVADAIENEVFKILSHNKPVKVLSFTNQALEQSKENAIYFLKKQQKKDGSFKGFLLFPGASVCWLSAHVGFVLETIPEAYFIRKKICNYLQERMFDDGGWGYNRHCPIDLDSTVQALLLLHKMNYEFPSFILQNIIQAQDIHGGFPTYFNLSKNKNLWQKPHADITILVIELLKRTGEFSHELNRAEMWLAKQFDENGFLKNFWWNNPAYSIWLQGKTNFIKPITVDTLRNFFSLYHSVSEAAFIAHAVSLKENMKDTISEITTLLLNTQLQDGSWPCSKVLKVPHRYVEDAACKIYADEKRIFSTAHALNALSQYFDGAE